MQLFAWLIVHKLAVFNLLCSRKIFEQYCTLTTLTHYIFSTVIDLLGILNNYVTSEVFLLLLNFSCLSWRV